MKLHSTPPSVEHIITGCAPDYVEVSKVRYTSPLFISPNSPILTLPPLTPQSSVITLETEHKQALRLALENNETDILLVGSPYSVAQFYSPLNNYLQTITKATIGLEVMGFSHACGTYNILAAEHKKVAIALWF